MFVYIFIYIYKYILKYIDRYINIYWIHSMQSAEYTGMCASLTIELSILEYIYTYIHINTDIYIHTYINICMNTYIQHIYTYTCIYASLTIELFMLECMYIYIHVYTYIHRYIYTSGIYIFINSYLCLCMYRHVRISDYRATHAWATRGILEKDL
jgi:hypothetical protein